MDNKPTIIKVRRGLGNFPYSACTKMVILLKFNKLSEIRKYWSWEIKHGHIVLQRELDKYPDE